jgi:hypothetical protein
VSINNDAVATVENTNRHSILELRFKKNTNKLACHSRLTVWELTTETQNIGG